MQSNAVVWFEIYVQDMQRAKKFYEAVLDVKLEHMPAPTSEFDMEMWAFPSDKEVAPKSYGACGMLVKMNDCNPSAGSGTIIYFASQDCAVEASRVAANGGVVVKEKTSIGEHGFFSLARDTEGNVIGFHSM
ncbi:MAG: VOC family protein [Bdellovibrionales bacterium]